MKTILIALTVCLYAVPALALDIFVCHGKAGSQDVTIIENYPDLIVTKGRYDIAAGRPTDSATHVVFNQNELNGQEIGSNCQMEASSEAGSFTLEAPCRGGPRRGKLTNLNIPALGLRASSAQLACNMEEVAETW